MPRRRSAPRSTGGYAKRRSSTTYRRATVSRRAAPLRSYPKRPVPMGLTSLSKVIRKVPFLMAHIDPFLPIVRGVKVPDSNTMESDTVACNDEYSFAITTGTNVKAVAFNPALSSAVVPSTEGVGAWTWPATFSSGVDVAQYTNIKAASTGYRTVAHGIRLSCTLAPTTVTGFVHVAVFAPGVYNASTWPFPTTIAQLRDLPFYRKVTLASLTQSPLTVVNKFLDVTAFRYIDTTEPTAGYTNGGRGGFQFTHSWGSIFVAVEGAPSGSNCLGVEMIMHAETLAASGGSNSSSPAARGNPTMMAAAADIAANTQGTHFESEQNSVFQQATDAISEGARAGAQNIAEWGASALRTGAEHAVYHGANALFNAVRPRVGSVNINGQYRLAN